MSPTDLVGGRWRSALEALIVQPAPPETIDVDGARTAAEILTAQIRDA